MPLDAVAPRAAAIVCHGGYGSTLGALSHGVPLVMLPLFSRDQWANAEAVERVGAGIALNRERSTRRVLDLPAPGTFDELGPAVRRVIEDEIYRLSAERVADAIRALPDVEETVWCAGRVGAERQLQQEPEVGVLQPVAVGVAQASQPVAHRLGVDVERSATCSVRPRRRSQASSVSASRSREAGVSPSSGDSAVRGQVRGESPVGIEEEGEAVIVATSSPSSGDLDPRPPSRSASVARATGGAHGGVPPGQRRAERPEAAAERRLDLSPAARARSGSGTRAHEKGGRGAPIASVPRRSASRSGSPPSVTTAAMLRGSRQPAAEAAASTAFGSAGGSCTSSAASRRRRRWSSPAAAACSIGVALDRLSRQLVDVGEDRLREQVQRARLQPGCLAGGREPPPGHPRAEAICGEQRVEAAAGPHLAAPEVDVDAATGAAIGLGALDHLDELPQRLLDPGPQSLSERAPSGRA